MNDEVKAGVSAAPQPDEEAPREAPRDRRRRPLDPTVLITLGIAAIVVVATAIVLLAGGRQPATYPADSPESALQSYLRAWYDEDYDTAYGYFSSRARARMSLDEFISSKFSYSSENEAVTIDRVSGEGDRRTLSLTVEEYYGPGSSYSRDVSVRMVLESGSWRIDDALAGVNPYFGDF